MYLEFGVTIFGKWRLIKKRVGRLTYLYMNHISVLILEASRFVGGKHRMHSQILRI